MEEIVLNRTRCDLQFKGHMFSHNFSTITDPSCPCGFHNQTTVHLLFDCPLVRIYRHTIFAEIALLPDFDQNVFNNMGVKRRLEMLVNGCHCTNVDTSKSIVTLTAKYLVKINNHLKAL